MTATGPTISLISPPNSTLRSTVTERVILALILLYAIISRLAFINRPFQRDPESCGAFYGLLARNYLRWPLSITHAVPVQSLGIGHGVPAFYPNHPPLLPMFIAATYRLCGWTAASIYLPGEWQTRFSSSVFTLACIVLTYLLLRPLAGFRAAALAAFFFAVAPMTLLFGGQPDVINTQLVFFIMLTVVAYLRFHDRPSLRGLLLLTLAFLPAGLTDWPAFHLVVVLGLHFVLTRPVRTWPWIIAFGIISIAIFMVPYGMGIAVKHDWRWMSKLVERRTLSTVADSAGSFSAWDWFRQALFGHAYRRHNGPILPLTAIWIVLAATIWRRRPETRLIALLIAWAALHVIVGRQGVYVHEWWWWPLTVGAAMAAGVTLDGLCVRLESHSIKGPELTVPLIALLALFAAWNTWRNAIEWSHPKQITTLNDPLNYSLAEIGQAIRDAAPENTGVLLGENDLSLGFWYYADRPLVQNVWYPAKFEEELAAHEADLPFVGVEQEWTGPFTAYILPRTYANGNVLPMVDYLDKRYPRHETAKFLVWDLRSPNRE